jgi:hypothetical protein
VEKGDLPFSPAQTATTLDLNNFYRLSAQEFIIIV